jgi:hypothetical protein
MRVPSSIEFLSHPRFRATWMALAAGSLAGLAGLAVLGACSDAPVSKIAGPAVSAPMLSHGTGVLGSTAHHVYVCVDLASDPGPGGAAFTFAVAAMNEYASPFPWFEKMMTPAEVAAEQNYVNNVLGLTANSYGPFGAATDNDVVTAAPSTTPGNCVAAFERADTCTGVCDPAAPADHPGNRMWITPIGVVNKYATVSIAANVPAGYTFTLSCVNDDPDNPISCTDGGYASANVFHGSTFTYKFTAPPETPCPAGTFTWKISDGIGEENWPAGNIGDILVRYDQFPAPNDNSYGINAVGWDGGHTFGNLTGSDKAGIQIRNNSGIVKLSFEMDYLSAKTGTPSGYASLGVTGGDGDMLVGTATGISVTTSLANNLNETGYCVAGNCTVAGTNLLVNSPPTDPAHQTYVFADPGAHGLWDFHNTYYARISPSNPALAGFDPGTWIVEPNVTALHNSPDKPCPPGPFSCADITIGNQTFGSKEVKVDVNNINNTIDAFVTGVHITWPAGNGALKSVKVGGDVIWSGTINGTSADLLLADLAADAGKRKIAKHSDEDIKFTFANNVTQTLGLYTASLDFGDTCNKPILP